MTIRGLLRDQPLLEPGPDSARLYLGLLHGAITLPRLLLRAQPR